MPAQPDITDAEIEQLLSTMLEVTFQQEILAEFTEHEGQVFRFIEDNLWRRPGERITQPAGPVPDQPVSHAIPR